MTASTAIIGSKSNETSHVHVSCPECNATGRAMMPDGEDAGVCSRCLGLGETAIGSNDWKLMCQLAGARDFGAIEGLLAEEIRETSWLHDKAHLITEDASLRVQELEIISGTAFLTQDDRDLIAKQLHQAREDRHNADLAHTAFGARLGLLRSLQAGLRLYATPKPAPIQPMPRIRRAGC